MGYIVNREVVKLSHRRADPSNSQYLGSLGQTTVRPSDPKYRKVLNLAPFPLGTIREVSNVVWMHWIGLLKFTIFP